MPLTYSIAPRGLRGLAVFSSDGQRGDLCAIDLRVNERTVTHTASAAGVTVANYTRVAQFELEFNTSGITYDALAILTGRPIIETAYNDIPGAAMELRAGDRFPLVTIYAESRGDTPNGRQIIEVTDFRLTEISGAYGQNEYMVQSARGVATRMEYTLDTNILEFSQFEPNRTDLLLWLDMQQQYAGEAEGAELTEFTDYGGKDTHLDTALPSGPAVWRPNVADYAGQTRTGAEIALDNGFYSSTYTQTGTPPPYCFHMVATINGDTNYIDEVPFPLEIDTYDIGLRWNMWILEPGIVRFQIVRDFYTTVLLTHDWVTGAPSWPVTVCLQGMIGAPGQNHQLRTNTLGAFTSVVAAGLVTGPAAALSVPFGGFGGPYYLHELLFYQRQLTSGEFNQLMADANTKWQIALT